MKITSDLHIHTNLSSCAKRDATFEGYVANAAKDGLTCLGFTDHLWDSARIPGVTGWYAPQNVEHVLQLKEKLPLEMDGVRLLFGCETEFAYDGKLCLAEESFEHWISRYVIPVTIDQRYGREELEYLASVILTK